MGHLRLLAYCVIVGAIGILAFSGVSLWHSAYDLNAKYPYLAATGAVCYLAIECLGLGIAYVLWQHRLRVWGLGMVILTLAMALYLVRLDLNVNVSGRADREAQRETTIEERRADRAELATQVALRSRLQEKKKLTADERRALADARRRIAALEARWGAHAVVAGEKTPDASWVARWLGADIQSVDDIMAALPVFLQVLVRLLLLPIGLRLLQLANERDAELLRIKLSRDEPIKGITESLTKPSRDSDGSGGEEKLIAPPAHTGPRLGPNGNRPAPRVVLNESHGRRDAIVYERPESRISRDGSISLRPGQVSAFIADCLIEADGVLLKSSDAYNAYKIWCATRTRHGISPLAHAKFGEAFALATGQKAITRSNGAHYRGWQLRSEVGTKEAGRSNHGKDLALAAAH